MVRAYLSGREGFLALIGDNYFGELIIEVMACGCLGEGLFVSIVG